jgi:hypothetical protein
MGLFMATILKWGWFSQKKPRIFTKDFSQKRGHLRSPTALPPPDDAHDGSWANDKQFVSTP